MTKHNDQGIKESVYIASYIQRVRVYNGRTKEELRAYSLVYTRNQRETTQDTGHHGSLVKPYSLPSVTHFLQ